LSITWNENLEVVIVFPTLSFQRTRRIPRVFALVSYAFFLIFIFLQHTIQVTTIRAFF